MLADPNLIFGSSQFMTCGELLAEAICQEHELVYDRKRNLALCLRCVVFFRGCGLLPPVPVCGNRPFLLCRLPGGAICCRGSTIKTRHNECSPLEACKDVRATNPRSKHSTRMVVVLRDTPTHLQLVMFTSTAGSTT